jgi:F-type H+-transporting ATPase subunit b
MINIDIVFLFQTVTFLVLLFLLNILLYKPIRKVMADRDAEISAAREKTVSVDADVREKMADYERKLREVKAGATEERGEMVRQARSEETILLDAARRDATDTLTEIRKVIRKESEESEGFLRERADALSRVISEKLLGRSLS